MGFWPVAETLIGDRSDFREKQQPVAKQPSDKDALGLRAEPRRAVRRPERRPRRGDELERRPDPGRATQIAARKPDHRAIAVVADETDHPLPFVDDPLRVEIARPLRDAGSEWRQVLDEPPEVAADRRGEGDIRQAGSKQVYDLVALSGIRPVASPAARRRRAASRTCLRSPPSRSAISATRSCSWSHQR